MAAPLGNKFWETRERHGRKPLFETPQELWVKAVEYFEWVEKNPLIETKAFHFQGNVITAELPKIRAMTITGLCFFIGLSRQGWSEYRAKNDFSDIIEQIEAVIYSQKFEGAAARLLNASIISQELGLDKNKDFDVDADSGEITINVRRVSKNEH